jgi:LptA/(LptD N-terminal domain) LPS transport protein
MPGSLFRKWALPGNLDALACDHRDHLCGRFDVALAAPPPRARYRCKITDPIVSRIPRGHAEEIVYEAGPGTVRLSNAYITDGKNEINGPLIVYSLRK